MLVKLDFTLDPRVAATAQSSRGSSNGSEHLRTAVIRASFCPGPNPPSPALVSLSTAHAGTVAHSLPHSLPDNDVRNGSFVSAVGQRQVIEPTAIEVNLSSARERQEREKEAKARRERLNRMRNKFRTSESLRRSPKDGTGDNSCSICLEIIEKSGDNRMLNCGHVFHRSCVEKWLNLRRGNDEKMCPVCRFPI